MKSIFFKVTKPFVYSKLIYFDAVIHLQRKKLTLSVELEKEYLLKELELINDFFIENNEFCLYFMKQMTHLDDKFFLRENLHQFFTLDITLVMADPCFSTSHDYKVAKYLAFEKLKIYLNFELWSIDHKEDSLFTAARNNNFSWTGSKIELVEFIYSILAAGFINIGVVETKKLMEYLGMIFNIDLHDYARIFHDIKARKLQTKGLDHLKSSLEDKINQNSD